MERYRLCTAFGQRFIVDLEKGRRISEEVCAAPHITDAIRRLTELAATVREWEDRTSIPHSC
ncbi:hypothetical protein PRIPAC_83291 [Pristionchus pacificus]|uniref:Uncharacterized protein n=1 Tax=Pristionchus pacificus TaxID=54126 RepID=A0A2A6BGV1_PRIPA|nr:hypothetical protein PRIPAC_83291 [Pristionchus pacificus]|eukprot:PDM65109.1 hypothetical protein PRIPAC_53358 [Pristionchus pacificus]